MGLTKISKKIDMSLKTAMSKGGPYWFIE